MLLDYLNGLKDASEIRSTRIKLSAILESSQYLQEAPVIARLLTTDYDHEIFLVYRRVRFPLPPDCDFFHSLIIIFFSLLQMKEHEKALQVLVDKLHDQLAAEEYCIEFSNDSNDLFFVLFQILLNQSRTSAASTSLTDDCVKFLEKYAKKINPVKVFLHHMRERERSRQKGGVFSSFLFFVFCSPGSPNAS
jgi:hypothetical protein